MFENQKTFPLTRRAYIMHVASSQHNFELVKYNNEWRSSKASTEMAPSVKSASVQSSKSRSTKINNELVNGDNNSTTEIIEKFSSVSLSKSDVQSDLPKEDVKAADSDLIERQKVQQWLDSNEDEEPIQEIQLEAKDFELERLSVQSMPMHAKELEQPVVQSAFDASIFSYFDNPLKRKVTNREKRDLSQSSSNVERNKVDEPVVNSAAAPQRQSIMPIFNPSIASSNIITVGKFTKPCPAYEMMNLYNKFPHLNPSKVPNPLKPSDDFNSSAENYSVKIQQRQQNGSGAKIQKKLAGNQNNGTKKAENKPANGSQTKPNDAHPITIKS